ncbi:hypothetical protein BST81_04895 [Leptolyngbya sp. 'hensonii']|nr:hypothetical protein BST81_04895 [Leptolyngbya sp. 'hensonii']
MVKDDRYILAKGSAGADRLQLVNDVHGLDTANLLLKVGLQPGMAVADIGCGIGTVSCWMGQQVGSSGAVLGIDASPEQLEQARLKAQQARLPHVRFVEASAYETELPSESFDLVYCRFLLMHLQRPLDALREMQRLVKPGGILVCEESDFTSPFCVPASAAFERCFELYLALGDLRGHHFRIGSTLYRLFVEIGLTAPEVSLAQPALVRGDAKRLPEWTLAEIAPALLAANLTTAAEIDALTQAMAQLAQDPLTLFGMARMTQVWAPKEVRIFT